MPSALSPAQLQPLVIFVVENHPDTLKYLRMFLEQLGHEVLAARSMVEALAELPGSDCDVLISDIGLPDGDGWQLLRKVALPLPYAIAMSGYGMSADRLRSKEAGYRHHILKPFEPDELEAMLEEAARERAA
jgi:two-component system CheB/CheR fusion protein